MSWTCTTLNLNGLRSAHRRGLASWMRRRTGRPDVLCLQETRIQHDQITPELQPARTYAVHQADALKKGYAGTAVWSRLPVLDVARGTGLDWSDDEGRLVRVDLEPATVVSVYVPSGSSGPERQARKDLFMEHFLDVTRELRARGRPTVICGDFNVAHTEYDIHNPRANKDNSGFLPHERAWMGQLLDQGWVDVWRALYPGVKAYSWWSNRGQARELDRGWRLDYVLATPDLARRAEDAWIDRAADLSDHAPVSVRFG